MTDPDLGPPPPPPEELPSGSPGHSIEAALGIIPPKQAIPLPRWLGPLALCCLIGMLPWIIFLAFTIPQRSRAEHYDLAWIGRRHRAYARLMAHYDAVLPGRILRLRYEDLGADPVERPRS